MLGSQSPPNRSHTLAQREEGGHTPDARPNRSNSGNGHGSPRTQLPSFNNLTSNVAAEEEENLAKRRRMERGDGTSRSQTRDSRAYSSPQQEYDDEEERQYRRDMAARQSSRRSDRNTQGYSPKRDVEHFEASSMAAPLPQPSSAERRESSMLVEDGFDSNVPLARRRGDAAHAKASRLHIDTGSSEPNSGGGGIGSSFETGTARKSLSSMSMHGVAKSAPPHKMSFTDREGLPFDPRGEPPPPHSRTYTNGPLASTQPYYPSVYTRKEVASQETQNFNDASPNHSRRTEYGPQHQQVASQNQQLQHPGHRHALSSSVGTPLTAVRANAFVPQTATLPSPAYHTTHFMRNPMGQDVRGSSSAVNLPPKTAGLNPPQTARLPEHLRSPPSSKTQFLSLFSNFYDSLTDSRTLKATLEDQVRRSNTLLQTLQKSSRVLELTVDRRVREERILWEAKVQALEERCLRLERHFGTTTEDVPPPPPAAQSVSPGASNGNQKSPSQQDLVKSAVITSPPTEIKEGSESKEVQMEE